MLNDALLREVVKTKAIMFVGPDIIEKEVIYKDFCFCCAKTINRLMMVLYSWSAKKKQWTG